MDSMMKATVIIFLVIILLVCIFNMIRLGTTQTRAPPYAPNCNTQSINLVDRVDTPTYHRDTVREQPNAHDTLVYKTKSVEPISSVI